MQILITICARGGSKGVPRKNIKTIAGKPLIAYSILAAQNFAKRYDAEIILSTEDEEIRAEAAKFGLTTDYRRPQSLAGDKVGKVAVIRDAWQYAEQTFGKTYDYVLDLDVTSPLRTMEDLEGGLQVSEETEAALVLYSVNPAHRNPYFNMVEAVGGNLVKIAKRPDQPFLSRQDAPEVYDINGSFYFYKRAFLAGPYNSVTLDHQSAVYVMPHICFDVDAPVDFMFLKYLIEGGHLGFEVGA
jgi:CMP-N-acetylneuraminic acid synthetase